MPLAKIFFTTDHYISLHTCKRQEVRWYLNILKKEVCRGDSTTFINLKKFDKQILCKKYILNKNIPTQTEQESKKWQLRTKGFEITVAIMVRLASRGMSET